MKTPQYIFTSERLGFRNWIEDDTLPFSKINADKKVMEHFPFTLTDEQNSKFY